METIVNKITGKVLYSILKNIEIDLMENEIIINKILIEDYLNPYYNFETETFYDFENTK